LKQNDKKILLSTTDFNGTGIERSIRDLGIEIIFLSKEFHKESYSISHIYYE